MFSALIATALAAAPVPDFTADWTIVQRVELVGWSKDSKRVALRLFDGRDSGAAGGGDGPRCDTYVDGAGQHFGSGLSLIVLENGKVTKRFRVQAPDGRDAKCTPLAEAKKALTEAKAELASLGIELTEKGTQPKVEGARVRGPWNAGVVKIQFDDLTDAGTATDDSIGTDSLEGTFRVTFRGQSASVKFPFSSEFRSAAGHLSPLAGPVFISPDQKRAVVFVSVDRSFYEQSQHLFFFDASAAK